MLIVTILTVLIALLHVWFLVLEMFFWQKPLGLSIFHLHPEFAKASAALAANQGLYNGFLSAGLFWSVLTSDAILTIQLKWFFLTCVAIAGLYGALTVNRRILYIQALPAILALIGLGLT